MVLQESQVRTIFYRGLNRNASTKRVSGSPITLCLTLMTTKSEVHRGYDMIYHHGVFADRA